MAADLRSVTACEIPTPVLPPAELTPEAAAAAERTGLSTFYGQFGHAPGLIDAWLRFYQPLVTGGAVELRTKELCRLRIAARNGCMFCLGGRFRDERGAPVVDDDDVDAVLGGRFDDDRFTPRERAALTFTEAFRTDPSSVDAGLVAATLEHFTEGELIELAICLAQFTGMGQLFAMLGIPSPVPAAG
ncbi:MAG TPA: carboxymuconolactone decarboxylase family protein [Acidimicrobiales bacterium]